MHGTQDRYSNYFSFFRNLQKMMWKVYKKQYRGVEIVIQMTLEFSFDPVNPLTWILPNPTLLCGFNEITIQMLDNILEDILREVLPTVAC